MRTRIKLKKRVGSSKSTEKNKSDKARLKPISKPVEDVPEPKQPPKKQSAQESAAYPPESLDMLKSMMQMMKEKYDLSLNEAINIYQDIEHESKNMIPLSIFSSPLSPSESLCRYLKDHCGLTYHQIADIINRDDRSVWTSYKRSTKKYEGQLTINKEILLPVEIFRDRTFSMLESIVKYLVETYNFTSYKIAKLLKKNPSAIATVHKRVLDKQGD